MTKLLEQAFKQVAALPASEQDAVAAIVMEELASEQRWGDSFAKSQDALRLPRRRGLGRVQLGSYEGALSVLREDVAIWFWIGPHSAYERVLRAL